MTVVRDYRILATWHLEAIFVPMVMLVPVQTLLSSLVAVGLGFVVPDIDSTTAAYLATGAPTMSVLLVGVNVLPQTLSQEKVSGAAEFYRTLPAAAPVRLAAQLTPHLINSIPGAALALVVASIYYDFSLHPSLIVLPVLMAVACSGAAIGNVIGTLSPHPIATTVITNVALFFIMLFSPLSFPVERLPRWLQAVHELLPFESMANLVRGSLLGTETVSTDWLRLLGWAGAAFILSAAFTARRT